MSVDHSRVLPDPGLPVITTRRRLKRTWSRTRNLRGSAPLFIRAIASDHISTRVAYPAHRDRCDCQPGQFWCRNDARSGTTLRDICRAHATAHKSMRGRLRPATHLGSTLVRHRVRLSAYATVSRYKSSWPVLETDHIRDPSDRHPRHRICQVVASQKFVSEEAVAILRHSRSCDIRFGMSALKRTLEPASDTPTTCPVRFPLQPSCCLTDVHRPVHQVGISMPRDATDRPLPVSRSSSREKFLNNRAVLGSATKMRKTPSAISMRILQTPW